MIEKRINGKENDSIQARTDSERQNTDGHRPTKDGRTWTDKHGQTRTDKHGRTWADKTPDKHERTRTENTRVLSVRVCFCLSSFEYATGKKSGIERGRKDWPLFIIKEGKK